MESVQADDPLVTNERAEQLKKASLTHFIVGPEHPELDINTAELSPMEAAQEVLLYLLKEDYIDER